ncbi:hypothetical protein L6452_23749 [Arctium lappa]|uniref:Uncharacterized protein n=1 Tax=Arctium lappa TaxID=4217 RepID=A0ACB9A7K0_ARCLA|nr:hypothetical protein L6452_23749 [Arctium lappa]
MLFSPSHSPSVALVPPFPSQIRCNLEQKSRLHVDLHSLTREVELTGSAEPISVVFVEVNDEIRSSKQCDICMDEDATFNEGGDVRLPSDSSDMDFEVVGALESKLLSAKSCKKNLF